MSTDPPAEVSELIAERTALRGKRDFAAADAIRERLRAMGWDVIDSEAGSSVRPTLAATPTAVGYARPEDLASVLDETPVFDLSVQLLVEDAADDLARFVRGLAADPPARSWELVCVANAPSFDPADQVRALEASAKAVELLSTSARLGWADARNLGLRRSRAELTVMCDTSIEPIGDFLSPLANAFDDPGVGLAGPWGMRSGDGRHFEEVLGGEVDAVQAYCLAVRRDVLRTAGLFDHRFGFYRNADLDFSFQARDAGWRAVAVRGLPLRRHTVRAYAALPPEERERLSRRNFYRYLRRWGDRGDLLVSPGERSPDA